MAFQAPHDGSAGSSNARAYSLNGYQSLPAASYNQPYQAADTQYTHDSTPLHQSHQADSLNDKDTPLPEQPRKRPRNATALIQKLGGKRKLAVYIFLVAVVAMIILVAIFACNRGRNNHTSPPATVKPPPKGTGGSGKGGRLVRF